MCSYGTRLLAVHTHHKKLSAAELFLDVKAAFESLIRQLLFDDPYNAGSLRQVLEALGFDDGVISELADLVSRTPILAEAGMEQNLRRLVCEVHSDTWQSTQGPSSLVSTRSGSRAGNPLSDILFNFLVAKTMRAVCVAVEALGFVFRVPDWDLAGFGSLQARVSGCAGDCLRVCMLMMPSFMLLILRPGN